jgi:DNA polymerase III delta prime subunit
MPKLSLQNKLDLHNSIKEKLDYFYTIHKIPNIIFHGPSGSGKKTIMNDFINKIYGNDKEVIKSYVMYVNCAHGKGIKFIREDLKFFAKTHINSNGGDVFKSIILLNADKLTVDAQSALRRCIELFSHNTRFFIIIEDKYKLLKPILSRFCEIYVPEPIVNGKTINLHKYIVRNIFDNTEIVKTHNEWIKKELNKQKSEKMNGTKLVELSEKLYEKGYSCLDIINYIETSKSNEIGNEKKYELLMCFNRIRKEFRSEKLLMLFMLNLIFLSSEESLENISYI